MREYAQSSSSSRAGLGCLYHVNRVGTSLRGLKGMLPHIGADACERSTAQRHSKLAGLKDLSSSGVARWVGWLGARSAVFGGCFQLWREGESAVA